MNYSNISETLTPCSFKELLIPNNITNINYYQNDKQTLYFLAFILAFILTFYFIGFSLCVYKLCKKKVIFNEPI